MYKSKNARGVVIFLQDHNIRFDFNCSFLSLFLSLCFSTQCTQRYKQTNKRKLLEIVTNLNMTKHFLWVASDSWGTKMESIDSNNLAAEGAITFLPKSYEIREFSDYFQNLKPNTNKRNVWFNEFWVRLVFLILF